jgi:hypothetical protein
MEEDKVRKEDSRKLLELIGKKEAQEEDRPIPAVEPPLTREEIDELVRKTLRDELARSGGKDLEKGP